MGTSDTNEMATVKTIHWVSSSVIGVIFIVFGIVGNILSLIVWSRKSMRSSTGTFLIFLSLADISLLLMFLLTDSIIQMSPSILASRDFGMFYAYFGYPFFFLAFILSIWMLVGVTVDRYLQVCWPLKAKVSWTQRRVCIGAGCIFLFCFIVNIPHFKTFQPADPAIYGKAFSYTDFGKSEGSLKYEFWVHCMFLVLFPWLSLLTFNILIIKTVVTSNRMTKLKKENSRKTESQLTRLLLTVTFTFMILIILQCVAQCFYMLQPGNVNMRMVDEAFSVAKLGCVVNSSINFFLYCYSGRKFRNELKKMCHNTCNRNSTVLKSSVYSLSNNSSSS
ncbi:FMRFamide receptor-like [Saccostrea cucullata]|uniref:FMRFamide receptor-like n=1 Tax=Saccostrea cuccullata TaxID=36930 RepID=UPI002ED4E16D